MSFVEGIGELTRRRLHEFQSVLLIYGVKSKIVPLFFVFGEKFLLIAQMNYFEIFVLDLLCNFIEFTLKLFIRFLFLSELLNDAFLVLLEF